MAGIVSMLALLALLAQPVAPWTRPSKADPTLLLLARVRPQATISVIVREAQPRSDRAERTVAGLGGIVVRELPIMGGFAARLPGRGVDDLASSTAVTRVWADGRVVVNSTFQQYGNDPPNTVWTKSVRLPSYKQMLWMRGP